MRKTLVTVVALAVVAGCKKEDAAPQPVEVVNPAVAADSDAAAVGDAAAKDAAAVDAAKPAAAKRFIELAGEVTIDGQPAAVGGEVGATSTIKTGKGAHAIFTLGPDSIFEMKEDSTITLGKSERKETSVKLAIGSLWSFLPKGSSYEVVTANAVAGVRGTIFFAETKSEDDTYICACDGEVAMQGGKMKKPQNVMSKHAHKSLSFIGKKPPKKAGLIDHTDAEAVALLGMMDKTH